LASHSGREADYSPPSSAEVKEWVELYLHSPNTPSWRGAQGEHRGNFTFTFTLVDISYFRTEAKTKYTLIFGITR
jgi:hypothetical protein